MNHAITMSEVNFRYQQPWVLETIDLNLEQGKFYALLGPNGAGKSTLFNLLCQLLQPTEGSIHIAGYSTRKQPRKALAAMGIVYQQSTLDIDLTVEQNLHYHASLHGLSSATTREHIEQELRRFALHEKRNTKIRALNGGHRRRVEIARALLHQPQVLLLDEASVGLDMPTRDSINQHIRALCQERGITVLSSTHLVDEVLPQDNLLLLHHGEILLDEHCGTALEKYGVTEVKALYQQLTRGEEA